MQKSKIFVGYDKVSDAKNNTLFIIYIKEAFEFKGETLFKKSSLVVDKLPEARVGDQIQIDWKSNKIMKVEAK